MGNGMRGRWLRAAIAASVAAAAIGAHPGEALGAGGCQDPKTVVRNASTDPDPYNRWYAGQCLASTTWVGIDGYVRLSVPALPANDDQFLADWLGTGDAAGDWVQAGLEYPDAGAVKLYPERTFDTNLCGYSKDPQVATTKANNAVYAYSLGRVYDSCRGRFDTLYALKFNSINSSPVAYGWLTGSASVKAVSEYGFWYGDVDKTVYTGNQRFGLNNSGAYNAGYAIHLYNGTSWSQWTQTPTVKDIWTVLSKYQGGTYPTNKLYYNPKHSYDAFTAESNKR